MRLVRSFSAFSEPNDVRDLTYLFGLDKKVQSKDPFFHNANSMIRKSTWKKNQFDETIKHIEDRLWASSVLKNQKRIILNIFPKFFPKQCDVAPWTARPTIGINASTVVV